MEIKSKALEVNIADHHVDVEVDAKYSALQEVMAKYYGLMDGLNTFLKELSHPYKNWDFIIQEARGYSLDYFHLLKTQSRGPEVAGLFVEIFTDAIETNSDPAVRADAADNLLLYLQKIILESDEALETFMPVLNGTFHHIRDYDDDTFTLFIKSYYQLNRLAEELYSRITQRTVGFNDLNLLLVKYFQRTYNYWIDEGDPLTWFEREAGDIDHREKVDGLFNEISLEQIQQHGLKIGQIANTDLDARKTLEMLLALPGYNQIVETYRQFPRALLEIGTDKGQGNRWKIIFLFHMMNTPGLSMIHEEALRDINRTLSLLIGHENDANVKDLIERTFSIIQSLAGQFPATALNCVLNMGKGVYETDDIDLINYFIDAVIDLGFQTPMISGVGNDWQIKVNVVHIQNIRTWLEVIELNPKGSIRLLSALIIHLSISGVFLKDTDLFPRDITRLLNSGLEPVYNLAKQLTRLFPTFFNDIGAEGQLRDISTKIDEITHRRDILIHFLRKQSHVESSNLIIGFMEATLYFWQTREKDRLRPFVPPNIFNQIDTRGVFIDGVHQIVSHLEKKGMDLPDDYIAMTEEELKGMLAGIPDTVDTDVQRVQLAAAFYKLLHQKYRLDFFEMDHYLAQLRADAFPDLERLKDALAEPDLHGKLSKLLDYLGLLKGLILSSKQYEIREDIYKKRHFTVDIPSMYGSYYELKFDALGLAYRIESLVNVLFEEMVESMDLSLITKATFFQIYERLQLFNKALKLDGISSAELDNQMDFLAHSLEVRGFTFTQYLDIYKGFSRSVENIRNDYFNNVHEQNLNNILSRKPIDEILAKYMPQNGEIDTENLKVRISEIFFRDRIATSLGLQQLDLFLTRILNTIFLQSERLHKDELHQLLLYDPQRAMTAIEGADDRISSVIYLGNKGLNLVKLNRLGLPVPPGFTITAEVFRFKEMIFNYPPAEENFREQVARQITALEKTTGKTLGDLYNPLLLSVRSGSAISQPGMMDTFLNVGINEEIATGMAARTGNTWFAWDNYRRFLQTHGMAHGLLRNDFDAIINDFKQRFGTPYKKGFTGEQMKRIALTYKAYVIDSGFDIVEDPLDQIHMAMRSVFGSWDSPKAKTYRSIMGISDDWGTAATVQSMVFGNISQQSGTGVLFSHNPRWPGDTVRLWGDFTVGNQGEDVVSGLVNTLPISIFQQETEHRQTDQSLERDFPEIFAALEAWTNSLIDKEGWSPQEIEFTFENPTLAGLYLLQTRDMAMRERKKAVTFEPPGVIAEERLLGHGIGVSGGAMSGRAVFSLEEIDRWRDTEPDTSLILVRGDTVPDDIREIYAADGLLTARGGVTSHAAVVAHQLERTCVVGCGNLVCNEEERNCLFDQVTVKSGEYISIDGQSGLIGQGFMKVKEE